MNIRQIGRWGFSTRLVAAALTVFFLSIVPTRGALAQGGFGSARAGKTRASLPIVALSTPVHLAPTRPGVATHVATVRRAPDRTVHALPLSVVSHHAAAATRRPDSSIGPVGAGTTIQFVTITTGNIPENGLVGGTAAIFTDSAAATPSAANYAATFNWGDGTVYSTADGNAFIICNDQTQGQCELSVSGHAYADEATRTVTATVYPAGSSPTSPSAATDTGTLYVGESDSLTAGAAIPLHLTNSNSFSGTVATFTNSGSFPNSDVSDFTATIDWGDTQTSTGSVSTDGAGNIVVTGSHTYAATGSYAVSVTLSDDSPGTATATATTAAGTIQFTEITGGTVQEGTVYGGLAAMFVDGATATPNPAGYAATFNWGDGTVFSTARGTASIACNGNSCDLNVNGHAYADEGTYTVTATVYPAGSSPTGPEAVSATGTLTASEADFGMLHAVTITPTEGQTFSGTVASLTDEGYPGNPLVDFTARIDWGDGTATDGTLVQDPKTAGLYDITGTHTYAEDGSYPINVTFSDDPPSKIANVPVQSTANVADAPLTVAGTGTITVPILTSTGSFTAATFADTAGTSSTCSADTYTYAITYNGVPTSSGTVPGNAACTGTVTDSRTFALPGTYTVCTTVKDVDGGTSYSTCGTTIKVANPASTAPSTPSQRATAVGAPTTPANFRISMTFGQSSLTTFSGMLVYADNAGALNLMACAVGPPSVTQCRLTIGSITRSACGSGGSTETIYGTYLPAGSHRPLPLKIVLVAGSAGRGTVQVTLQRPDGSIYSGPAVHATVTITC